MSGLFGIIEWLLYITMADAVIIITIGLIRGVLK